MAAYKRLSVEERIIIQNGVDSHTSLKKIGYELDRHPSSVARELKAYRQEKNTYAFGGLHNRCDKRKECTRSNICSCSAVKCGNKMCSHCRKVNCTSQCPDYKEEKCLKLSVAPYVCNGCEKLPRCPLRKMIYSAAEAEKKSAEIRSDSRQGMCFTEDELKELNENLSPRLKLGQSIHHILVTSPDEFTVCEKTIYTLVNAGKIDARPIDMPRAVRLKPRKKSKEVKVDKACRNGRDYEAFKKYMDEHPDQAVLEGDTVEGVKGGKCLLTLTWTNAADFQVAFLRDHNNSASVTAIVNQLYESFGYDAFHKVFPSVWLLDNGTEFSNPTEIEKYGIRVFYCDPSAPYQKGSCENTHENIRKVIPKGKPFDDLDQPFFDLLLSHCNGLAREKFNDHSAYDMFSAMFGKDINIKEKLHIRYIPPKEVHLKPQLRLDYLKDPKQFQDKEGEDQT